jgi:hypothetical protein
MGPMDELPVDELPIEVFLDTYPDHIRRSAQLLRDIVMDVVPDAVESIRVGWRVVGYAIPTRRRPKLFALIGPEPKHVHLFFQYGVFLADPDRLLQGAQEKLRQVRYLTFTSPEEVRAFSRGTMDRFLLDAAQLAPMTRDQRLSIATDG